MNAIKRKEGLNMEKQKYFDAVDTVCLECAFGEETCTTCPVRQTVDKVRQNEEENRKNKEIRQAMLRGMFK